MINFHIGKYKIAIRNISSLVLLFSTILIVVGKANGPIQVSESGIDSVNYSNFTIPIAPEREHKFRNNFQLTADIVELQKKINYLIIRLDSLECLIAGAQIITVQDSGWFLTNLWVKPDSVFLPFTRYEIRWGVCK